MKQCKICGKKTNNFRMLRIKGKQYYSSKCRECEKKYSTEWQKENKDKHSSYVKTYVKNNPIKIREIHKKWWNNLTEEKRKSYYKYNSDKVHLNYIQLRDKFIKKYGISYSQINTFGLRTCIRLYKKNNYKCSVCDSTKRLCVHHKDGVGMGNHMKLGKTVNNKLDNLLLVCASCHRKIHGFMGNGQGTH